jgi:hypothetical protein
MPSLAGEMQPSFLETEIDPVYIWERVPLPVHRNGIYASVVRPPEHVCTNVIRLSILGKIVSTFYEQEEQGESFHTTMRVRPSTTDIASTFLTWTNSAKSEHDVRALTAGEQQPTKVISVVARDDCPTRATKSPVHSSRFRGRVKIVGKKVRAYRRYRQIGYSHRPAQSRPEQRW